MMRKNASRMRVVSVYDLSASESMRALRHLRRQNLEARARQRRSMGMGMGDPGEVDLDVEVESDEILSKVYQMVGGRTSYLSKVSRADDMLGKSSHLPWPLLHPTHYAALKREKYSCYEMLGDC